MIKNNNNKRAVSDGKREKEGASLPLFSLPIVPCALSFFPLPNPSTTKRGLFGGEREGRKVV